MIFSTIEDEATLSGYKITNIFKQTAESIKGISFGADFTTSLEKDTSLLSDYILRLNNGDSPEKAFAATMQEASEAAKKYVKETKLAKLNVADFASQQRAAEVATIAQGKSLKNIKTLFNEYNSSLKESSDGVTACGLKQKDFVDAVSKGNASLGNYLQGLNGAKGSMTQYVVKLGLAKVATIGLQVATSLLNAAISMGISFLIQGAITGISKLVNYYDDLHEKVTNVTEDYNNQKKSISEISKESGDLKDRYAELSKHVDSVNGNVDLSNEEYQEYLDICNKLGETFPSLIKGYDSQGNAILSCKDNVELLNEAYKKLRKENNNKVINEANNIVKDFKHNSEGYDKSGYSSFNGSYRSNMTKGSVKVGNELLSSSDIDKYVDSISGKFGTGSDYDGLNVLAQALTEKGYKYKKEDKGDVKNYIKRQAKENKEALQALVDEWNTDVEEMTSNMKSLADAYFDNAILDKDNISSKIQNLMSTVVGSFDYDFLSQYKDDSQGLKDYINTMVDSFSQLNDQGKQNLEFGLNAKTALNNNECTYSEYLNRIDAAKTAISGMDENIQTQVDMTLHDEDFEKKFSKLVGKNESLKSFLSGKTKKEIEIFYDYVTNKDNNIDISKLTDKDFEYTFNLAIQGHEEAIKSIDDLKTSLSETKEFVSDLSSAISESASATGLSADAMAKVKSAFSGLDGYDAEKLFQTTSYGIKLNRTELEALNKEYRENKAADYQRTVNDLSQQYVEAAQKLDAMSKADEGYQEQLATAKGLKEQLTQARQLQSQFEGLTSAYNDFVLATSQSNDRDAYENIGKSYESMKKILNSGWYGDQSLNKYLDLLLDDTERTGNAITDFGKLTEKIKGTNFSIMDFFTLNDDGDATVDGIYNLIDAIQEKFGSAADEIVKKNEKGGYSFDLTSKNIAKVSDALGISEEAIHKLLEAMPDAGWDCQFGDAAETIKTLKEKADEAAKSVEKLSGGDKTVEKYKLNIDTENLDEEIAKANSYIKEIDGSSATVEVKTTETNYVEAQLDILIQKKNELSRPTYMTLSVEQVATGAQDMLKKLQEYQYALETVNGLELKGKTNTEEYTNAKEKLNEIATEIFELSENSDIDFGIDVNSDNYETFKKKVQEGKINVPLAGDTTQLKDSLAQSIKSAIEASNIGEVISKSIGDNVESVQIVYKSLFGKEKTASVKIEIKGKEDLDKLKESFDNVPSGKVSTITTNASEVKGSVDGYASSISKIPDNKNTNITNSADNAKGKVDNYRSSLKAIPSKVGSTISAYTETAKNNVNSLLSLLRQVRDNIWDTVVSVGINISTSITKGGGGKGGKCGCGCADGTAHVNGTAFARGNWGTRTSGTALGGELGQELVNLIAR